MNEIEVRTERVLRYDGMALVIDKIAQVELIPPMLQYVVAWRVSVTTTEGAHLPAGYWEVDWTDIGAGTDAHRAAVERYEQILAAIGAN